MPFDPPNYGCYSPIFISTIVGGFGIEKNLNLKLHLLDLWARCTTRRTARELLSHRPATSENKEERVRANIKVLAKAFVLVVRPLAMQRSLSPSPAILHLAHPRTLFHISRAQSRPSFISHPHGVLYSKYGREPYPFKTHGCLRCLARLQREAHWYTSRCCKDGVIEQPMRARDQMSSHIRALSS